MAFLSLIMKKSFWIFSLVLIFLFSLKGNLIQGQSTSLQSLSGQSSNNQGSVNFQDLSTVNVDNLTDDQIKQIIQQAQKAGISQSEFDQQALQRGLPPDQLGKLDARIATLNGASSDASSTKGISKTAVSNRRKYIGGKNLDSINVKDQVFDNIGTKIFGEDLFNNKHLTFEPNLRIPTPANYIIGTEDQILIDIYGYSEANYKLMVSPEGNILIPNIGPVKVIGLSISEARSKVFNSLRSLYQSMKGSNPKTFASINLGDIRSIKVILVGEVKLPGTYTLPSLASVFNALYSSGGPNHNGSFRNIELIRDNKVIERIDVYEFLMNGLQKENIRLQDQDIIKVYPYKDRVEFVGEVKRPGIYEIKPGETLSTVLNYAAGFTDNAYTHRIKIIQKDSREKTVIDVQDKNYNTYKVNRGDLFIVEPIIDRFSNRVQIGGSVFRPGTYALEQGLTLSQLIRKADGIKEDAFTDRATLVRLNQHSIPEIISFDVNRILDGTKADIPLKREDVITIFSRFDLQEKYTVIIEGEVIKPDTVKWAIGMHLQDLILRAGGLTDAGSYKRIEITRRIKDSDPMRKDAPIAQVFRFDISPDLKSNDTANNFVLEPFDYVSVRTLPGYDVQQFASIIGEVIYGGKYGISQKNQRISDLVKLSGGLTAEAFPTGATLIRGNNISKFDRDQRRLLIVHLKASGKDSVQIEGITNKMDSINRLKSSPVGINLEKILQNPGSKYDLILNDGDIIKIPKKLETVQVSGDVLYPSKIIFDPRFSAKHYIFSAGGFSQNAVKKRTYVIYANGSVKSTRNFIFWNSYPKIKTGAQIIVPDHGPRSPLSVLEVSALASSVATLAVLLYTTFK